MRKIPVLLLLLVTSVCNASQIPIGLHPLNITVWNYWEYRDGKLEHFLSVRNNSDKEVKLKVDRKTFKESEESSLLLADKTTELFDLKLKSGENKLTYPDKGKGLQAMEFFEDGKRIGLLDINTDKPEKYFLDDRYIFYSNTSINGGSSRLLWMRFFSITEPQATVGVTCNFKSGNVILLKAMSADSANVPRKLYVEEAIDKEIVRLVPERRTASITLHKADSQTCVLLCEILESRTRTGITGIRLPVFGS